jgi:hypothetical protein
VPDSFISASIKIYLIDKADPIIHTASLTAFGWNRGDIANKIRGWGRDGYMYINEHGVNIYIPPYRIHSVIWTPPNAETSNQSSEGA